MSHDRPTVDSVNENLLFQAYATVVSAAEGSDRDSDNFGKVDEVKQYPSVRQLFF